VNDSLRALEDYRAETAELEAQARQRQGGGAAPDFEAHRRQADRLYAQAQDLRRSLPQTLRCRFISSNAKVVSATRSGRTAVTGFGIQGKEKRVTE
jgi:hypothetical protein